MGGGVSCGEVRQNMEKLPAIAHEGGVCKSVNGILQCYFSSWHCCWGIQMHQWCTVGRLVLQRNHWRCQCCSCRMTDRHLQGLAA